MLTDDQIKQLVLIYREKMLDFGEICRSSAFEDNFLDSLGEWKEYFLTRNKEEEITYKNGSQYAHEMYSKFANKFQDMLANRDLKYMMPLACLLLRDNNLPIEMPSRQFDSLCRELLRDTEITNLPL